MTMRAKQLLVTGGAGFIGSHFIRDLLATEPETRIVNLDLLSYAGTLDRLAGLPDPARHRFVQGDIADRALVDRVLHEHAIDAIVHFAAESHVDRSIAGPAAFIQTNIVGTWTLLEAARQYWLVERGLGADACRFHHVSTDEVYGSLDEAEPGFTEGSAFAPNSPYSASKAASDHLVRAYHQTYGLPVVTSHSSNNYGPYQHAEKFIPTVIRCALAGAPIPLYGDGRQVRDWLYVEDHCRALLAILRRGRCGETYNVGGGNSLRNIELAQRICTLLDELAPGCQPYAQQIRRVDDRLGHDQRYAVDSSKLHGELRWVPEVDFDTGLRLTLAWYLARVRPDGRVPEPC